MIRLTLLIPTLDRSGAEKQLTLLATHLPKDEFDVQVIALTRGGPYADVLRKHGIPLTILNKRTKLDWGASRRLKEALKQSAPDILHPWLFAANAYGRLAVDRTIRPRIVVSERCVDTWKSNWQLWLDRRLISRTDQLIGNSQSVVEFYRQQGFPSDRMSVIYNGIEREEQARGTDTESVITTRRQALLQELNLPDNSRLVGFVGRLAKQKRVEDLLWAAQLLRQMDETARVLIIGDGPERSRLEQFSRDVECSEFVRFLGHRDDASQLLPLLKVFWLGSDFEGLSNSLMEAMTAGVPVVATNIPPNRELVQHGRQGYLVNVGDGVAFAQYTVKLLNDSALARQLGNAGESHMGENYSVQRMVDSHIALYHEVLHPQHSTLNPQFS